MNLIFQFLEEAYDGKRVDATVFSQTDMARVLAWYGIDDNFDEALKQLMYFHESDKLGINHPSELNNFIKAASIRFDMNDEQVLDRLYNLHDLYH